jgi:hypothetical protein
MSTSSPLPEFLGFTIAEYDIRTQQAEDPTSFEKKTYQTNPWSMDYNAQKFIYRIFVKVVHEDEKETFPSLLAIMYRGTQRTKYDYVLPLVPPIIGGGREASGLLSMEYDTDKSKNFIKLDPLYRTMMNRDPNPKIPYYYGILQFDYHHCVDWYQSGTLTIEINIGVGVTASEVDQWLDPPQTYQWGITNFISP